MKTMIIALKDELHGLYVDIEGNRSKEFDPYHHVIFLHELDDGYVLESELTGWKACSKSGWVEQDIDTASKFTIKEENRKKYIYGIKALQSEKAPSNSALPPRLVVEFRDDQDGKIDLEPFGPSKTFTADELALFDIALEKGGALLEPSEDDVKNSRLLGELLAQYSEEGEDDALKQWAPFVTSAGSHYSVIKHGAAKVYIWKQPKPSKSAQDYFQDLPSYRYNYYKENGEPIESEFEEFLVIYKSGKKSTVQKYLGFGARTALELGLATAIKKLIYATCRKIFKTEVKGAITKSFALSVEKSMGTKKTYVKFFSKRVIARRALLSCLSGAVAITAAYLAIEVLWGLIFVPQKATIKIFNRSEKQDIDVTVGYLDNVADRYYASENEEKNGESYIVSKVKKTGDEFDDPDIPGVVDGYVVSYGQVEMDNDNTFFEGFGTFFTLRAHNDKGTGSFISYNEVLIPYGASNKMSISINEREGKSDKEIYENLRSDEYAALSSGLIKSGDFRVVQTFDALTGHDHVYLSTITVK
ncbi:hypothetical protein [Pseudoalteromonas rubra]|uniref:Uncharacterized protein n=1 Tax=Pseudoalteromonas rubra TaxID=43658 RepID=A0A0F4QV71_9GAMM|nr:hypothetical protein [Pseudoalteromonas rubra]KJZ11573.1 hypothetical protein TW77_04885 [Pseudoalteromonas rubra]